MDIQMKRGMLDVCVLAVLEQEDSYGYQIIKEVSACIEISESTLYPILKRLETQELVTSYSVEHAGRLRKYYRITNTGRQRLVDFLEEWKEMVKVSDFIVKHSGKGGSR